MIFLWISLLTQCCVNTSHGAVAVEVKSAPSWPSRAHDLSPLLRTVRSHKDSDSALTGMWIFHFLGQKLLVLLIPWQNSKNSRWVVENYLIKSCFFCCYRDSFCAQNTTFLSLRQKSQILWKLSSKTVAPQHKDPENRFCVCLFQSSRVSETDKERSDLTLTLAALSEMRKAKGDRRIHLTGPPGNVTVSTLALCSSHYYCQMSVC